MQLASRRIAVRRFLKFHWLCIKHAWRGCLTRANELATLLGGVLLWAILWSASSWLQQNEMIEPPSTYWGAAGYQFVYAVMSVVLAFAVIFVARLVMAPVHLYWAERDRADVLSNQLDRKKEINNALSRLADCLSSAKEMMNRRIENDDHLTNVALRL